MRRLIFAAVVLLLVAGFGFWWWQQAAQTTTAVSASLASLVADEDISGYARAIEPGGIIFPRDMGAHEAYQTEWWYYTGNLTAVDGREFGYQFTIFRRALTPPTLTDESTSQWRTNQVYFAHFTVSDIEGGQFYQHERFSRGAAGLAGAQAEPYRVWIEDWSATELSPGVVRLTANSEDVALDIELRQSLPPILQGDAGLSQKGPDPGNASYYYSLVQQPTVGSIRLGDEVVEVAGVSWKDHEYSTNALSSDVVGWDWFSVQLEDGSALMMVQIRQEDGTISPFSAGTFVAADGSVRPLTATDMEITVTDNWRSPTSGAEYPAGWQIRIPALGVDLTAVPLMPNQELNLSTTYWEGAVGYEGTLAGQPITGRGYVELTGYAGSMRGRL